MEENNIKNCEVKKYFGYYTNFLFVGNVLVIFSLFSYLFILSWHEFYKKESNEKLLTREISVTGEGKIFARPDVATFSVSIITDNKKIKEAQTENSKKSEDIINYLKKVEVKEKDIKTIQYNVTPQYEKINQGSYCWDCKREISSYKISHVFTIKVRNLEKIDEILDGIVNNNTKAIIGNINFEIDNKENFENQARGKAIEKAKEKSEILAKNLGVKLKRITSFNEGGSQYPGPIYARSAEIMVTSVSDSFTPSVQSGEQEIISNVTITYEFE